MRHLPTLAALVCLPLLGCGGADPEQSPGSEPAPREQLLGTYVTTGTLTLIENGVSSSRPASETLVLHASDSRDALTLELASLGCELRGKMSGRRGFTLQGRACELPPHGDCTATLNFTGGSGLRQGEDLGLSLQAHRITRCGNRTSATSYSLELIGSRK